MGIKKESEILKLLMDPKIGIMEIMKQTKSIWNAVDKVRKKYADVIPARAERVTGIDKKTHIGARFDGPLTEKVLAECERLGINRNDFLEMAAKSFLGLAAEIRDCYLKNREV